MGAGFLILALEFLASELAEHTKHLTLFPSFMLLHAALGI